MIPQILCAICGKPLHALTAYGVSVPLEGDVKPVDLCSMQCLYIWASGETWPRNNERRLAN